MFNQSTHLPLRFSILRRRVVHGKPADGAFVLQEGCEFVRHEFPTPVTLELPDRLYASLAFRPSYKVFVSLERFALVNHHLHGHLVRLVIKKQDEVLLPSERLHLRWSPHVRMDPSAVLTCTWTRAFLRVWRSRVLGLDTGFAE